MIHDIATDVVEDRQSTRCNRLGKMVDMSKFPERTVGKLREAKERAVVAAKKREQPSAATELIKQDQQRGGDDDDDACCCCRRSF